MSKKKKHQTNHYKLLNGVNNMSLFNILSGRVSNMAKDDADTQDLFRRSTSIIPSSKALIYFSELEYIAKCIQDYPNIETGGQLYGAWTASGAPRVIYAIGPGPRANHQSAFFQQDVEYLKVIGAKLKEYGLQHIGEWHSHHRLGIPHPSSHDAQTMQNGIQQLNLSRFLLCIGSINDNGIALNPFNFAASSQFVDAQWEIINSPNRLRDVIDNDLRDVLHHPRCANYTFADTNLSHQRTSLPENVGWFSKSENRQAFKTIIDNLRNNSWINEVVPQISDEGIVSLKIEMPKFEEIIQFPRNFPNEPFTITRRGLVEGTREQFSYHDEWVRSECLFETFTVNYTNHLKNHF